MTEMASEALTAAAVETIARSGGLLAGRAGGHRPTLPRAPHDFADSGTALSPAPSHPLSLVISCGCSGLHVSVIAPIWHHMCVGPTSTGRPRAAHDSHKYHQPRQRVLQEGPCSQSSRRLDQCCVATVPV